MKNTLKIGIKILVLLLLIYFAASRFLPSVIDKKYNHIIEKPPYTVSLKARQLNDSLDFIADLHCDALLWNRDLLKEHDFGAVDIPRMIKANEALQAFTIVTKVPKGINFDKNTDETDAVMLPYILEGRPLKSWFNLTQRAISQCDDLNKFAAKSKGTFYVIKSKSGLQKYLKKRQQNKHITAGFLGIEGMHALSGKLSNIDVLYNAGVRMMSPVHFFDNKLGSSAHGVLHGGLSEFGKKVIKKMQAKNMILDVAHSSEKMLDDILAISTKPILSSHTGVKGIYNNGRNLSDAHLIGIANTGGIVGIAFFDKAIKKADAFHIAQSIKYTVDLIGVEHVALGSDFDGAITAPFDVTGLPLIIDELLKLGFTPQQIGLVMGGNVKRFLLENLP
ncbi:MAG: membrane dipeptidase [Flavobacteriaceae bacterium]|nr:membrane dipeptidase [Flavobacteriaceae bacterium]